MAQSADARSMTRIKLATVAVATALFLGVPTPALACPDSDTTPAQLTVERAQTSVTCLINQRRRKAGLRKVRLNARLTEAAQHYSALIDTLNFFSHYSPAGSTPLSRITKTGYLAGYGTWGIGENLRYGTGALGTPRQTVIGWMKSAPHRHAMLSRRYRDVGLGVSLGSPISIGSQNAAIYTADFGYRS